MTEDAVTDVWEDWQDAVNMTASELESWLATWGRRVRTS